jgi:drug/metabolite transporter (DMT)-like permease
MVLNLIAIVALVTAATFAGCRFVGFRIWSRERPWPGIAACVACLGAGAIVATLTFASWFDRETPSFWQVASHISNYGIMLSGVAGTLVGISEKRRRG